MAVGLGIEAIVCIYCSIRFRSWYGAHGESELFLERLKDRNTRVGIGAACIAVLIVYSLVRYSLPFLDLGPLIAPVGSILIGSALAWMMWGPVDDWLTVRPKGKDA